MYVCSYECVVYVCGHVYMYVYVCIFMYLCMYVLMYVYMCNMYGYVCLYVRSMYVCENV